MTTLTIPLHCQTVTAGPCIAVLHRFGIGVLLVPEGEDWTGSESVASAARELHHLGWQLCEDEEGWPALLEQGQAACCGRQLYGVVVSSGPKSERMAAMSEDRFMSDHMAAEAVLAHTASMACCG